MSEVKFSKEHEWVVVNNDIATIGITKHATELLGDIVFAELPEKGSSVNKDGTAVESVTSTTNWSDRFINADEFPQVLEDLASGRFKLPAVPELNDYQKALVG